MIKRILKNEIVLHLLVIIGTAFFFTCVLCFVTSDTSSMSPTIMINEERQDRAICNKLAYVFSEPERGDIVCFRSEELDGNVCKRVIGIGGDTITFADGYVYVNYIKLDESSYIAADMETNCLKEFLVPEGYVFVLGDNRENSNDSRFWNEPYIPVEDVWGKILFTIPFYRLMRK